MPNSKEWHISQIAVEYKKATGKSLASDEVILFDDGERNISEALKANVIELWITVVSATTTTTSTIITTTTTMYCVSVYPSVCLLPHKCYEAENDDDA